MMAFGQIVLPIAALIAVGLLFVGVKLFFLTPPNHDGVEVIAGAANAGEGTKPASGDTAAAPEKPLASETAAKPAEKQPQQPKQKVVLAGPVDPTKTAKPAKTASKPTAVKQPASKPAAARDAKPTQIATTQGAQRWGVQIGAFSKEEGAKTISEQAKKDGYATSISTVTSSGTTFYRVRVSAGDTRETAERLAAELGKKNYPVQVLPLQ